MQLDLFAELRALQRHALVTLQSRCNETDFTDAGSVLELQDLLNTARRLLHDCAELEATHLYPLIAKVGVPHFDLLNDRRHVQEQFDQLFVKLEAITNHTQSANTVWRVLVGMEGEMFSRVANTIVYAWLIHLESKHAATTAVSLTRGSGALPAAQRPLQGALANLKETHRELLTDYCSGNAFPETEERVAKPAELNAPSTVSPGRVTVAA